MATNTKLPLVASSNGVITAPPKGIVGGNRKKQKRRARHAAKSPSSVLPSDSATTPGDGDYDEDPLGYGEDDYEYSDAEPEQIQEHVYGENIPPSLNGLHPASVAPNNKKKKKKKRSGAAEHGQGHDSLDPDIPPPLTHPPTLSQNVVPTAAKFTSPNGNIWNTSTQQERQNIKDFWLGLSENERKSLLKIEKEAVLKKMKQQQKHSCSCTVCGRKRTAIEEELEVLYEGYYEELEQYAHHDQPPLPTADGMMPGPLQHRRPHPLATPPPPTHHHHHKTSHMHEHLEEDEYSGDEEYSEEEEYSDDEPEPEPESGPPPRRGGGVQDFFNFGEQLTVKGILTPWVERLNDGLKGNADNLLTVADDLLKNDGRKFIEMMEQLAERRMQRENRSQYDVDPQPAYPPDDAGTTAAYSHAGSVGANEEFDDDEASYDSGDDYDDDIDDEDDEGLVGNIELASTHTLCTALTPRQGELTEEQRMQEGRRMFQIFAARMFEQRVLNAYREKVAAERQRKLLEELDDESRLQAQREAKKQRDAQKKKDKKKQQQQVKAEEKARKDAEKAAEEARAREEEEKRQEEQRRKKEEQRKKREEEKRKADEERARKEADKIRRQQEDQLRREESERKARELKVKKEEVRKREREEREAREKEARDRKAQEEREKREREAKTKAEREAQEREKNARSVVQSTHPQITKRPSQAGMVAVPGVGGKQIPSNISSPRLSIATPAIPKVPTPAKQRQPSQTGPLSSPKQAQTQPQLSNGQSKTSSPGSTASQMAASHPRAIAQKAVGQPPSSQAQQPSQPPPATSPMHPQPIQPPPGMHPIQAHNGGFGGMSPLGYPGFPPGGPPGPMMHNHPMGPRGGMPMYPQQNMHMGGANRMPYAPAMGGMPLPPPGVMPPHGRGMFQFENPMAGQPPPGFTQPMPPVSPGAMGPDAQRSNQTPHSRQASTSEKERFESAVNQPIARPAPIQRPSSVKPEREGSPADIDDLSNHLGSSALLDDSDEPIVPADNRRHSGMSAATRSMHGSGMGSIGGFGAPVGSLGGPGGGSWNTPPLPYSPGPGLNQPGWGSLPGPGMHPWGGPTAPFSGNINGINDGGGPVGGNITSPFASLNAAIPQNHGHHHHHHHHHHPRPPTNRPLTLRLALCQACKQLSATVPSPDNYYPIDALLRHIDLHRPLPDGPPSLAELEAICETEGDSLNGGGELHVRREPGASREEFVVKWEPDNGPGMDPHNPYAPSRGGPPGASGLGEIGSPMPFKAMPARRSLI